MKWVVLKNEGGVIMLMAKHTVEKRRPFELDHKDLFNDEKSYFLSNKFRNRVFSDKEKSVLISIKRKCGAFTIGLPTEEEVDLVPAYREVTPEPDYVNADIPYSDISLAYSYWLDSFRYDSTVSISSAEHINRSGSKVRANGPAYTPCGIRPVIGIDVLKLAEKF